MRKGRLGREGNVALTLTAHETLSENTTAWVNYKMMGIRFDTTIPGSLVRFRLV